jgi:hypothetical protein
MKKFGSLLIATGIVCCVTPALAIPPYSVDDPVTAMKGQILTFTSLQSSEVPGKETYMAPDFTACYGITDSLQFKLESGYLIKRFGKKVESGLEDTLTSLKWRFLNETKKLPQFGVSFQTKLPTADASRGLGTGDADYRLTFMAAKNFGRFKLAANAGQNFMGAATSRDNAFYGIVGKYQLTEKVQVGVQWYGNASSQVGKREEMAWGVGSTYRYAPDHALLFSLGRSERGYSNLNAYAGLQVNFK